MDQTTDLAITGNVIAALGATPRVSAAEVIVRTQGGHVHLQGIVGSLSEKTAAEEIARGIEGVRSVLNDLTVSANRDVQDLQLQRRVNAGLADAGLPEIGARVEDGTVFLMGVIRDMATEERAMEVAAEVPGVRDVLSELEIAAGQPSDDAGLVNSVAEAISDDPGNQIIRDLDIRADDGAVTIRGNVTDPKMIDVVTEIVRRVPGVRQLENLLEAQSEAPGAAA